MIEGTLAGQAFQAEHVSTFGDGSSIGGRCVGAAHGPTGDSTVMCIIDANNNIVMGQVASTGRSGGYGTVMAPTAPSTTYNFTLNQSIGSSSPIVGRFTIVGAFSVAALRRVTGPTP